MRVAEQGSNDDNKRAAFKRHAILIAFLCCFRVCQSFPSSLHQHHRQIVPFVVHVTKTSPILRSTATALRETAASSSEAASGVETFLAETSTNSATSTSDYYLAEYQTTVTFSPYSKLLKLQPGEYETSPDPLEFVMKDGRTLRFCVKLYPRGGGHTSSDSTILGKKNKQKSGFGMSYKVMPLFSNVEDKVGVYLQYIPNSSAVDNNDFVDASFSLRMIGRQRQGPKFDVEFRSGMRFVASPSESKLKEGRANDFGAHLMQTSRLIDFLGVENGDDNDDPNVKVQVSIRVHRPPPPEKTWRDNDNSTNRGLLASLIPRDIRRDLSSSGLFTVDSTTSTSNDDRDDAPEQGHDTEQVRVGRTVVPVLRRLSQRPRLFHLGAYPGVEYRIMRIIDPDTDQDLFYSRPGADYELKPIYPLVAPLERPWPVRVNERDLPKLYTATMYNTVSAIVSLVTAITGLVTAFLVSQAVSLFFIPSHSMDPTLQVGDVLVVDKVTPRFVPAKVGDVVLFHPPNQLLDIVARSGGKLGDRDLFVKRVVATGGDRFRVDRSGQVLVNDIALDPSSRNLCSGPGVEAYIQHPGEITIQPDEVAVLGDCSKVSIDSRVWGTLPTNDIIGRPLIRLWPLDRFGSIPRIPDTLSSEPSAASTTSTINSIVAKQ